MKFDVTLVTYADMPDLSPDDALLADALRTQGLRVRAAVWTDTSVDWSLSQLTVLRSTWDYFHKVGAFRAWLTQVSGLTLLVNDAATIRWNMDKRYLLDLQTAGVPIVPTLFFEPGEAADVAGLAGRRGWRRVVVKPTISGSAFGARLFDLDRETSAAEAHTSALLARGGVMVQPYLEAVEHLRERALIFLGGRYSHAIRKTPFNPGAAAGHNAETSHEASFKEIAFCRTVLAALDRKPAHARPAYARVDVVPSEERPLLMELELIEPALFFRHRPAAAAALADVIAEQLSTAVDCAVAS